MRMGGWIVCLVRSNGPGEEGWGEEVCVVARRKSADASRVVSSRLRFCQSRFCCMRQFGTDVVDGSLLYWFQS
jgi:hypothetical protein